MAFDTLIKGGTVYDGEHAEPTVQDIGIKDGVITALGHLSEQAKETIDADGAIVTPAWIDIHTHYDGQVTWDQEMDPSASHGCLLYTSPSPRDRQKSRMPSSA